MNEHIQYTYLSKTELVAKLVEQGVQSSRYHVGKLLIALGLSKRKIAKTGTHKQVEGRNEQFEKIEQLVKDYTQNGQIVISIDGKKKELLSRAGKVYCSAAQISNDHDFPSLSTGKVSPFVIYDKVINEGYMFLGQSSDTPDFAGGCLYEYLKNYGQKRHANAKQVLVLCDSGGSNGYRNHSFKEMVQWVANATCLDIRIVHYPSYCSKYNPCDHKLFPHVTRAMARVMLDSINTMSKLIKSRAKTKQGLKVSVRQIKKQYQTGIKATKTFLINYPIIHDTILPKWNYQAIAC